MPAEDEHDYVCGVHLQGQGSLTPSRHSFTSVSCDNESFLLHKQPADARLREYNRIGQSAPSELDKATVSWQVAKLGMGTHPKVIAEPADAVSKDDAVCGIRISII